MKKNIKNIYKIILLFSIIILFICPVRKVKADLYDECNQLSIEERDYIEEKINSYEKEHKYNVLVRFYKEFGNIDIQTDNWYSSIYNSLEFKDSIVFAINMDTRETLIIAYDGLKYVDFNDNSPIVTGTSNYLHRADYEGCIKYFLKEINSEVVNQKILKLGLMIVLNLIIFNLLMFLITRTYGQKDTTSSETYMNKNSRITGRRNIFLRKTVSKTKKSSSSSSGRHSGGHSHGHGGHGHF